MGLSKVIDKGYTLKVESWENDGDHYQTNFKTVQTLDEAKILWELLHLCTGDNDLGNAYEYFDDEQTVLAANFIKEYFKVLYPEGELPEDDEELSDLFAEIAQELLGYSEDYKVRVFDSCIITYSPDDIYLEEITFN